MSPFFADQTSTVDVEFPESGVTVTIKKYVTAGMREELENQMVRVTLQDETASDGKDKTASQTREARLQTGDFFLLQKMIVAVQVPEGVQKPHVPVSKSWLGSLTPQAVSRMVQVVNEHNPLFDADLESLEATEE